MTINHPRPAVKWNQVAAFRLSRHHLIKRATKEDLISVAGDVAGVHAQLLSAAQIQLRSRVRDLQVAHVDTALSERALVKTACMRRTLFLVPAADLAIFVRGTARRAEKEIRWALGKGVPERTLDAAIDAVLGILDRPLTRPEIAERASQALGVQVRSILGGGWGSRTKVAAVPVGELVYPVVSLLHTAAARGVVCYGPYQGNEPTFVRADAWIPHWQDHSHEQAEDLLLHRYLRAFAPATAADFALWTGITLREAREIWARSRSDLATVNVEGREAEILHEDLDVLSRTRFEMPLVRLLPYFDPYLLGHREKEHLVKEKDRSKVYRPQGWIAPVVLVNGRIAAVWKHTRKSGRLKVKVETFEPISHDILEKILAEAGDLSRFLGIPDLDIQIE